jgi:hypothetical protein
MIIYLNALYALLLSGKEDTVLKRFKIILVATVIYAVFNTVFAQEEPSIHFLNKVYLGSDIRTFRFQKDSLFQEKFSFENNFYIDVLLFQYKERFSINFFSEEKTGLGKSHVGLLFHPRNLSYCLDPYALVNVHYLNIFGGLDHRCFHEIDRKEYHTVFWNRLMIGINSKNIRLADYIHMIDTDCPLTFNGRWSWSAVYGYYLREFFGLMSTSKLMSAIPDYEHEFTLTSRMLFYKYRQVLFNLTGNTILGLNKGDGGYYCQEIGLDINFVISPQLGGSAFVNYVMDRNRNWFDTKDKLLEIGLRLYNR